MQLLSIGIDVGSTTSHLVLSRLLLEKPDTRIETKLQIMKREIVYRSPIIFTPFEEDDKIDSVALRSFVESAYSQADIKPEEVGIGAAIITGIAARKDNAESVMTSISKFAGDFVSVTAGPRLEAIFSAYGSGAVKLSRAIHSHEGHEDETPLTVMNVDMGGGTTKIAIVKGGRILNTTAVNIGARLIAWNEKGLLTRVDPTAKMIADSVGIRLEVGKSINESAKDKIASVLVDSLFELIMQKNPSKTTSDLLILEPPKYAGHIDFLIFSGGVSEYIYDRESEEKGDLGLRMSKLIKNFLKRNVSLRLESPSEFIGATAIGASQYSMQVSGNTVYISNMNLLPLKNVPIVVINLENGSEPRISKNRVIDEFYRVKTSYDDYNRLGFFFRTRELGYEGIRELITGIRNAIPERLSSSQVPLVLIFNKNIAKQTGIQLKEFPDVKSDVIAIDEIEVGEMSYIDVGTQLWRTGPITIVVKSLVFNDLELKYGH